MAGTLGMLFLQLVALVFPLAVLVLCIVRPRWRRYIKPFLLGVATFLIFQNLTRIPLLQYVLPGQSWYVLLRMSSPVLCTILIGGLSAGLFEEGGRFAMMHILKPHQRTAAAAIAFGIGHGGFEAAQIAVPQLAGWISAPVLVAAQSWWAYGLSGVERLLAIGLHIGLSVLVMEAVRKKRWWQALVSILIHGAANSVAVLTLQFSGNALLSEAALLPFSAVLLVFAVVIYRKDRKMEVLP